MTAEDRSILNLMIKPIVDAQLEIKSDLKDIRNVIFGNNGSKGYSDRITALETGVKVLVWLIGIGGPCLLAVGCFVGPRLLPMLGAK